MSTDPSQQEEPVVANEAVKELLEKDSKSARELTGIWYWITSLLGVGLVGFYFYSAGIHPFGPHYHRGIYVLITYILVFLFFPIKGSSRVNKTPTVVDILFAVAGAVAVLYWISQYESLNLRAGAENDMDFYFSILGLIVSIEVARRVLGTSMTLIGIVFLLYAYFGRYMPSVIQHSGFSIKDIAVALFISTNGVFGVMANVLATYVILFIFFGAFLQKSGAGKFFIDFPLALAGRSVGGPAKVAVMASALFGSVSGSAIANTVSTGSFTIPLMKRAGFKPHVAGAIEPAASIGGMFLPPIMGAGGFIMAEMLEKPYAYIMAVAIFPAFVYFFAVFVMIHLEAKRYDLRGIPGEEIPRPMQVLKDQWYMSTPLVLITILMIMGKSPGFAAFWATISCVVISWFKKETRMGWKEIWEAMIHGAKSTLVIGATVGVIGIIVGTIELTGIGLQFSDLIISAAENVNVTGLWPDAFSTWMTPDVFNQGIQILATVFLIALASLVLGMGVPVTAAYLITVVLVGPSLTAMGVSLLAAHMIVYWFSQDSNITPPVCVAAYAGAAIAGADPWKTGWTSFKYAKMLYVMPIMFAFVPATLLDGDFTRIVIVMVSIVLGTLTFSAITQGYFARPTSLPEWISLIPITILLFWPTWETTVVGFIAMVVLYLWQSRRPYVPQVAKA